MILDHSLNKVEDRGIVQEAERLFNILAHVHCDFDKKFGWEECLKIAPLTLEINQLKREQNAVIMAHSYVLPEIIYGVADYKSDSYALALDASKINASKIIFAGVVFMAETAKILAPDAEVVVPDIESGCSLADSITAEEVLKMKAEHPDGVVVCYINSSASVKAVSDVCVTSSNVYKIIENLPEDKILFIPDRLMGENIRRDLKEKGVKKTIITSDGTCIVHDHFDTELVTKERGRFSDLKVVGHPECTPEIAEMADFVGSTGKMMEYVKNSKNNNFMMLTECGLVGRLEAENPKKHFLGSCKICPYMKLNNLEKIRQALINPKPETIIKVNPEVAKSAKKCIDRMFELANRP